MCLDHSWSQILFLSKPTVHETSLSDDTATPLVISCWKERIGAHHCNPTEAITGTRTGSCVWGWTVLSLPYVSMGQRWERRMDGQRIQSGQQGVTRAHSLRPILCWRETLEVVSRFSMCCWGWSEISVPFNTPSPFHHQYCEFKLKQFGRDVW